MTTTTSQLAATLDAVLHGDGTVALAAIAHDSRAVDPVLAEGGTLFCCVPGDSFDGHDYAADAVAAGATAILVERRLELGTEVPQLVVPSVREAMGVAACEVYANPSTRLDVIGVTGTNGKTTIVHLLQGILTRDGSSVEIFGTLTSPRTTPEAPELQRRLAVAAGRGVGAVAMEVSSHALDLHRVDGTHFRVSIFTNLGHDHLDHHGSIEAYYQAKARLFTPEFTDVAIINTDDPAGKRLAGETTVETIRFGLADAVDLAVAGATSTFWWRDLPITLQLAGDHNVRNALAAALAAEVLGRDPVDIADALCAADPPRGRFEFVDVGQPFRVAVDYAHTPDALEAALGAARQVAGNAKVAVVFGCGGNRDQQKRPLMGEIATALADRVYVTSDNPRNEDPTTIIDAILVGVPAASEHRVTVALSRAEAITLAIQAAEPGDVVLIAGKGHETEQIIGDATLPFDDRVIALQALGLDA